MNNSEEINDEEDTEHPCGYYLRSKRRKVQANCAEDAITVPKRPCETLKRKNPIMHIPTEIISNVFQYISYHELSSKVRLVNHRFKLIAESILNMGFKKIENKLQALIKTTYVSLQSAQDDMEIRCVCKLLNLLEILNVQYSVIMSAIWRYVYNDYYRTPSCCMYGGLIIDAHRDFIWKFTHVPNQLYASSVIRDYALPPEVTKIVQMTKSFCVHFDKIVEESMWNCLVKSGCKIVDILDCGVFAQKNIIFEHVSSSNTFTAKYCYFFNNSWFVALPINQSKTMEWEQKQRMMHMRLRRIILAHNDMYLQQAQYEREVMIRTDATLRLKKPGNNVYTGYGDVDDKFFYYGVMNDGAYLQKFHLEDDTNDEEDNEEEIVAENQPNVNIDIAPISSEDDLFYRIPHLGVRIDVKVKCPVEYAPRKYMKKLEKDCFRAVKPHRKIKGATNINVFFECYGAYYPRLPTQYEYDFNPVPHER